VRTPFSWIVLGADGLGKDEKTRYLPLHPGTNELIHDYLGAAGHGQDDNGALFRPIRITWFGRASRRGRASAALPFGPISQ
jgi:hypothetical protein